MSSSAGDMKQYYYRKKIGYKIRVIIIGSSDWLMFDGVM